MIGKLEQANPYMLAETNGLRSTSVNSYEMIGKLEQAKSYLLAERKR